MHALRRGPLALVLAAALAFASCASLEEAFTGPVEAFVTIPAAEAGETEEYIVKASANERCQTGVRAFRNEDWKEAIRALKAASAEDPSDHRALFALGVAYEMTGDLDSALEHYQRANLLPRRAEPMYAQSVRRVKEKLAAR